MVEAGKLGEGCVSWLDVEDLLTISFLLGLGDRLGWDFAEGKKKQEHCSCRFFFSFEMQATYLVSYGRLETFPRCWVQPATPQLLFLWENIKRQMRVSFIVRKTAWDTTSEPTSTTSHHFVLFLTTNTSMQCARHVIMQMCYYFDASCWCRSQSQYLFLNHFMQV